MADQNSPADLVKAKKLLQELNLLKAKLNETPFSFGDAELLKQYKDLPGYIDQARKQLDNMSDSVSSLYTTLRAITAEYRGQQTTITKTRTAFRQLEDAVQDLKFDEQEINKLNISQLHKLQEKAKKNSELLKQEAKMLVTRDNVTKALDAEVAQFHAMGASQQDINDFVTDYLKNVKTNLRPEEQALLQLYYDQNDALLQLEKKLDMRIDKEKRINDLLGLSGAALKGLGTFMTGLGIDSGIMGDAIQEANQAMEDMAMQIEAGVKSGGRLQVMLAGVNPILRGFKKALTDPAVIIDKIVTSFFAVNKAAVAYTRLSGTNATNQAALNSRLATSVEYLEVAAELTNQLGMSATSIFDNDTIAGLAEAKNLLGLSAEQAGSLGIQSKLANTNIDSFQDNLLKGVSAGNQLNGSLVAPGVAMQDILNTSLDVTMALGNNPEALGRAGVAARAFGMSLQQVSDVAAGLLNFEDSISAELEAELMTGKSLNLERARELALTNDLEGLSKELAANGATAAEFSKMNRLEQDALAKALGMNREQLAKSILAQEASKNATLEQRAAVMGVTKEQMQSMDIQERMAKVVDKLAQAFAPIGEAIVPIIETLSTVLQPVAMVIGYIATGISSMIKPLLFVYGLYKSIQIITTATLAANRANYALKAMSMGQEAFITREKGVQGIMERQSLGTRVAYNLQLLAGLISEQGIVGIKTFAATLDEKSLGRKVIMNTYDGIAYIWERGKTLWKAAQVGYEATMEAIKKRGLIMSMKDLGMSIGKAAMGVIQSLSSIPVVGWALGLAAAATVVGLGAKYMMKDGIVDPKKGPVMTGEFGSVQLDPNDKAMYGADGKIKVGTNLGGDEKIKAGATIPGGRPSAMSNAARQTDSSNEIKQMRNEMSGLLKTLVNKTGDIYMDSNRVGKSLALGSYKSS